jgi:hypothetical protein
MELHKIRLLDKEYINIDTIENIAIPDCFVSRQNKIGLGTEKQNYILVLEK